MKFNFIYLIILTAVVSIYYIIKDFQGQSEFNFFGTAETDARIINMDEDVWVNEIKVELGNIVKKGDTLAILTKVSTQRNELQFNLSNQQQELNSRIIQSQLLEDISVLSAQRNGEILATNAEIRNLLVKDSLDREYRSIILGEKAKTSNPEILVKLEDLKHRLNQIEKLYGSKLRELKETAHSNCLNISNTKFQTSQLFNFEKKMNERLVLISPIDAYVEEIAEVKGMPIQAYREIFKLNPLKAVKVVGFIHEAANVPFHIGDSVHLTSVLRPAYKCIGVITSASPRLVELPIRLRRFIEIRAWGRELLITILNENDYFIGEKIAINLSPKLRK